MLVHPTVLSNPMTPWGPFFPSKRPKHKIPNPRPSAAYAAQKPQESTLDELPVVQLLHDPLPEIELWNDTTSTHRNETEDESKIILKKLREMWPSVAAFTISFPWILVEMETDSEMPPPQSTPFLICGLVAVFMREWDPFPAGVGFLGGRGEGRSPSLPEDILHDLRLHHIPSLDTFEYLHTLVPEAEHVSSYPLHLLFELSKSDDSHISQIRFKVSQKKIWTPLCMLS